jgi:hypothetical protein
MSIGLRKIRAARAAWYGAAAALVAVVGVLVCERGFSLAAEPAPAAAPLPPTVAAPLPPTIASPPPDNNMVRITFTTVPSRPAMVYWGKKRLGVIAPHAPLVVQRPRDSGPLDVVVRSSGYLSVQTRAYTFGDSKIGVKLTAPDQKKTLLGYREAPPEEAAPLPGTAENNGPDGGAPR